MARHWIQPPTIQRQRLKSQPNAMTFTVTGTRNDRARCFVQETWTFDLEGKTAETIIAEGKQIAEGLRERMETYLDLMCMCKEHQTIPCPVEHGRKAG